MSKVHHYITGPGGTQPSNKSGGIRNHKLSEYSSGSVQEAKPGPMTNPLLFGTEFGGKIHHRRERRGTRRAGAERKGRPQTGYDEVSRRERPLLGSTHTPTGLRKVWKKEPMCTIGRWTFHLVRKSGRTTQHSWKRRHVSPSGKRGVQRAVRTLLWASLYCKTE